MCDFPKLGVRLCGIQATSFACALQQRSASMSIISFGSMVPLAFATGQHDFNWFVSKHHDRKPSQTKLEKFPCVTCSFVSYGIVGRLSTSGSSATGSLVRGASASDEQRTYVPFLPFNAGKRVVSRLRKTLCYLTVGQMLCLALGLWIQDQLVVSTAQWEAEQNAVDENTAATAPTATAASNATTTSKMTAQQILNAIPVARAIAFAWICGLQMVVAYLVLARVHDSHSQSQTRSDQKAVDQTKHLVRTRDAVIFGLAKLADARDSDTGYHLERIALYSTRLAWAMKRMPKYRGVISSSFVKIIGISSALHDIGKVGVEDSILLNPGKLNDDERNQMERHAIVGAQCISEIELQLGDSNFLQMAREIALYHHERWDGTGYPHGLAGQEIPLAARIVAVADVYDALSVKRVYKHAFPHEECVEIIRREAGEHFDPDVVEAFLKIEVEFGAIASQFSQTQDASDIDVVPLLDGECATLPMTAKQETVLRAVLDVEEHLPKTLEAIG